MDTSGRLRPFGVADGSSDDDSNKAVILEYVETLWNRHDLEGALKYLAPEMAGEVIPHARELLDAFSDLHVEVLEPGVISSADFVVLRVSVSGVHDRGEFAGQPPSGRRLTWESIRIFALRNGRITATWAMQDRLGLMAQLGAIDLPAADIHWAAGDQASS